MSYYRQQLEDYLKTIDVKADRVLDVGGGALPVKDRVRSFNVKEYKILDNELEEMKQKPDIITDLNYEFGLRGAIVPILEEPFDVVFCLEVMEYIWSPVQALLNLNKMTKQGGTLFISFPFLYPHHNPEGKDMLRYTRWGVEKLLDETGFRIEELKSRVMTDKNTGHWSNFVKNEGMHPCRSYRGHNEIGYICKAVKR